MTTCTQCGAARGDRGECRYGPVHKFPLHPVLAAAMPPIVPAVAITRAQAESLGFIFLDGWFCDEFGCAGEATHVVLGDEDERDWYFCDAHATTPAARGEG